MAEVKKKIRPGVIELHPNELALVVHYEVQEVVQQPDGTQEVKDSSHATKKITVKSLNERTDLAALAAEVVDKCKLIHPSKVGHVQELLLQLQQRLQQQAETNQSAAAVQQPPQQQLMLGSSSHAAPAAAALARPGSRASSKSSSSRPGSATVRPGSASRPPSAHRGGSSQQQQFGSGGGGSPTRLGRQQQRATGQDEGGMQQLQQHTLVQASEIFKDVRYGSNQVAFLDELETYIEGLYEEDLGKRAEAAGMICQLFRNTDNLESLLSRETLLSTLARLMREDGLKSLELATAVAGCFLACSTLSQLHKLLLENQVGTVLMDLISLELLQRTLARETQEGPGSSAAAIAARAAAAAARTGPSLNDREKRLTILIVRQDRFFYIAFATLLHLAEDSNVQRKMQKKDIVGLLVALLQRPHVELLLLAVGFLRRLSVFAENKDRIAGLPGIIPQLLGLLQPGCGEALQLAVLRLLHNLTFDVALMQQMVQGGLVPLAVQLLDSRQAAPLAAGLLYQLSMEDSAKSIFAFCPGALPRLYESIMRALGAAPSGLAGGKDAHDGGFTGFAGAVAAAGGAGGDLRSVPELIALAVNLAHSKRTAEWFCAGERLERLLKSSLAAADELSWKLLRNLAVTGGEEVAGRLLVSARGMIALLHSRDTGLELFAEVLGALAAACDALSNSSSSDRNGSRLGQLVSIGEMMGLMQACFVPGALEDDALLEAVVLLGALAGQPEFDAGIAESGLLVRLVELIAMKKADDEFVLQVCWAFCRCLMTSATTQALLSLPQVVPYLVDLLQDSCLAVRRVAGACLDVMMDQNEAMAGTIRSLKFEAHNQDWLQLAGPEAHAIMAAAAAAAGAQWQQQQQQQQQQQPLRLSLGDALAGRRSAVSGSMDPVAAAAAGSKQQLQQLAGTGYAADTGQADVDMQYGMMSNMGGQRMVFDLDGFVGGMDDGELGYGGTVMVAA